MLSLSHPFPDTEVDIEAPTSTDWFSATSIKPCLMSLVGWKGEVRYIARYMMHSLGRGANRNVPGSIPILMETTTMPDASNHLEFPVDIQPCGGDVLTGWLSQESPVIEVNILPMPTERTAEGPPFKTVRLFKYPGAEDHLDELQFSLCPSSGRLCTITGDTNEIIVLDFLIPSWKDLDD